MRVKRLNKLVAFLEGFSTVVLSNGSRGYALMVRADSGLPSSQWIERYFPGICIQEYEVGGVMQVFLY